MIMPSTVRKIDVFEVEIKDLSTSFQFKLEINKVERERLLSLPNPNYEAVLKQHRHLRNITMNDMDKKTELLVHLIFGESDLTKIKVQGIPRVWQLGKPVAELTRCEGALMSRGKEAEINKSTCTKTSIDDYENLCRLDALGVTDILQDDIPVLQDLKDQLRRSKDSWCKTGLMWKENSTSNWVIWGNKEFAATFTKKSRTTGEL